MIADFYGPDLMSPKERLAFKTWYEAKLQKGEMFNFDKDILEYCRNDVDILQKACRSDVDILQKACLKFRDILLNIAGHEETVFDEENGLLEKEIQGGVDPFSQITIASVCMKVFKTKFLRENWKVKLRNDQYFV